MSNACRCWPCVRQGATGWMTLVCDRRMSFRPSSFRVCHAFCWTSLIWPRCFRWTTRDWGAMAEAEHDHKSDAAEHEHKHDGCCGHDHGKDEHAHDHGHSHEHGHAAPAQAASSGGEAGGDRWLTAQQYKGLGKWLKPWGKPPTGTTFWIQIITTAAVILISILKGVDTTVALVVSTGPAATAQAQQNPMFLAGGIVTALFGAVLGGGYLVYRYQAAQGPRDDKPPADAPEPKKAKATKAKEESKESKESKEEKRAARAARGEAEKAEALEKMEAELLIARQEVLAQAENEVRAREREGGERERESARARERYARERVGGCESASCAARVT
eukprot:705692-Prymnesium_polylepis.2